MTHSFTPHATQRAGERLSLTLIEIGKILDEERCLSIGSKEGKDHLLFWSEPDQQCFVAIRDPKPIFRPGPYHGTLEVVTILPLDYHANIAWVVPPSLQSEARALALPQQVVAVPPPMTTCHVKGYSSRGPDGSYHLLNICTVSRPSGWSLSDVILSEGFRQQVRDKLAEKLVKLSAKGEQLHTLFVRRDRGALIERIDLHLEDYLP